MDIWILSRKLEHPHSLSRTPRNAHPRLPGASYGLQPEHLAGPPLPCPTPKYPRHTHTGAAQPLRLASCEQSCSLCVHAVAQRGERQRVRSAYEESYPSLHRTQTRPLHALHAACPPPHARDWPRQRHAATRAIVDARLDDDALLRPTPRR